MKVLEVKDLAIGYERKPIYKDINFSVSKGDLLCIIGENGIGKSTLMKTLLGIVKPIEGKINFIEESSNHRFGYLPQQNNAQDDFPSSVYEIILSGTLNKKKWHPFYTKEDKALVEHNMSLLNILDLKDKAFSTLSGGQKQRVLIARALCSADKMLFLDEPISGLSIKAIEEFYETLELLKKEQITIIMISHDIHSALKHSTHILLLEDEIYFGNKEDFLKTEYAKRHLIKRDMQYV